VGPVSDPLFLTKFGSAGNRICNLDVQPGTLNILILPLVLYGCETWSLTLR
jgi:hypothetical protein